MKIQNEKLDPDSRASLPKPEDFGEQAAQFRQKLQEHEQNETIFELLRQELFGDEA